MPLSSLPLATAALLALAVPGTASAQLLFDRSPPEVTIVAPASGSVVGTSATVEATATDGLGTGVARVEYQLDGTAGSWTRLSFNLLGWNWSGTLDTARVGDGGHTLYVRAVDNAGNARIAWTSFVTSNPPQPPTGLVVRAPAAPSDGGWLDVAWTASSEPDVVAYDVYRSNAFAGPYTRVAKVAGTTWRDTAARNGTTWHYALVAVDSGGSESARTAPVSGTAQDTRAPTIAEPVVERIDGDSVAIRWTTHEPATGEVLYGAGGTIDASQRSAAPATAQRVVLDGLQAGVTYAFQIRATDAAGNVTTTAPSTFHTGPDEAPVVTILEPAGGTVVRGAAWLRAAVDDDYGLSLVEYSVGGIEWSPLGLNQITGVYEVNLAGAPDGSWDVAVRAVDTGGHSVMAVVSVVLDRQAPALEVLAPEVDAHLPGGEIHPFRVVASDASLTGVEWQIFYVPPDVELEAAPDPDPAAWEPLEVDPISGEYFVDWTAPTVVLEQVAYVYVRATDASGRASLETREISVLAVGHDYEFVGNQGQTLFGTVAIEALGPTGGNRIGMFVRGRSCTPGGRYTLTVAQDGLVHTASFVADGRGRGEALVELDTGMTDANRAALSIAGPGF